MTEEKRTSRFPIIITAILIALLVGSIKSISDLQRGIGRLSEAETQLEALQKEKSDLVRDIEYAKSDEFLEKAAIENLNMTKPGYKILVIEDLQNTKETSTPMVLSSENIVNKTNLDLWIEEFNFQNLLK